MDDNRLEYLEIHHDPEHIGSKIVNKTARYVAKREAKWICTVKSRD